MDERQNHRARQIQRVLWSVGEAHRVRRSHPASRGRAAWTEHSYSVHPRCDGDDRSTASTAPDIERPFELTSARRAGHVDLAIVGDLDATSAAAFLEAVESLVGGGARSIVVDLGRAAIIDDPGLSVLEHAQSLLETRHGEMVLKSPHSGTLALLARTGRSDSFTII